MFPYILIGFVIVSFEKSRPTRTRAFVIGFVSDNDNASGRSMSVSIQIGSDVLFLTFNISST